MVMNLQRPNIDSVEFTRQVVAERANGMNAPFFNEIEGEWCERVQQYIDASGSPPMVTTWPAIAPRTSTFLNLYLHPKDGSVQGEMLKSLRKHGLSICPACGEMGVPNTLDHYLPKSAYPHFCITPENLFPMCDACQKNKGTSVGNLINPRFFIHPYFDRFPVDQLIYLTISPPFNVPTFKINVVEGLEPYSADLVISHIRELKIEPRYVIYFRNEYRRLLRLVEKMRSANEDVLQTLTYFKAKAEEPTPNSWEHLFYSSVVANAELVNYLTNSILPELP